MKVKACMERPTCFNIGSGTMERCEMPPLGKVIVRISRPYESISFDSIWIGIEAISECSASSIKYSVKRDCKPKTIAIANFIDENKGKRLLDVLEMELP